MSPSEAWTRIETHLAASWHETPIAWPGVSFTPPGGALWIRPTPLFGAGSVPTYELHAVAGILQLDVFAPRGQGYGAARIHAEALRDLFAGRTFDALRFGPASGPEIGPDGAYAHLIVRVPFTVDEAR